MYPKNLQDFARKWYQLVFEPSCNEEDEKELIEDIKNCFGADIAIVVQSEIDLIKKNS